MGWDLLLTAPAPRAHSTSGCVSYTELNATVQGCVADPALYNTTTTGAGPHNTDCPPNTTALITSDCAAMRLPGH